MNCEGLIRIVSSYIDGELEATVVEEIELHLKTCHDCTILVQQISITVRIYYDSDLMDFPEEARARLRETMRRKVREERK